MTKESKLVTGDYMVLVGYFVIVIGTGVFSSLKNRGSVGGYFLAGQSANWWLVGLSLFASNIGSGHFVGLAGTAAASGIAIAAFELHAVYTLSLLGWFFVPVYRSAGVFTLPEYLCKRFGGVRIRMYLAVLSLLLYICTKISADLYSGAVFLNQAIPGVGIYLSVFILIITAAMFTITGGLTAVIWTDAVQTVIMLVGAAVLMFKSFDAVGGYQKLKDGFPNAVADTWKEHKNDSNYKYKDCGQVTDHYWTLMHPWDDPGLPWTGLVFGLTISAIWYWCTDQVIVQRALAAKNMCHAKMGCILASYLKVLPLYLIVMPGMVSRMLYTNEVACNEPKKCEEICENEKGCADIAFPKLVVELMPKGIRGLILSVMMSALISSLTSVFNSTATIFTLDVWCHIRKHATDVELMIIGRLCVVFLVVVSVIWLPILQEFKELFHYIQAFTAYLAPPMTAVFLLTVFWKRISEPAAFWGLTFGLVMGMIRACGDLYYKSVSKPCGEPTDVEVPAIIGKVHYLHFGFILSVIVLIFTVIFSLFTEEPPESRYMGMTFSTRFKPTSSTRPSSDLKQVVTQQPEHGEHRQLQYFQDLLAGRTFEELPFHTKLCLWMCGIEDLARPQHELQPETMDRSIYEPPNTAMMLHGQMILCLCVITGIWIFYSL